MATTKSKKALCHLVCEASAQVSGEILKQELDRNLSDLKDGILCYPKPTSESLAAFTAKRNTASKLTNFILDLSKILGVEETKTKTVLETYLSGENFWIYMTKFISWKCLKKIYFLEAEHSRLSLSGLSFPRFSRQIPLIVKSIPSTGSATFGGLPSVQT